MKKMISVVGTITILGTMGALAYCMLNKKSRCKVEEFVGEEMENIGKSLKNS